MSVIRIVTASTTIWKEPVSNLTLNEGEDTISGDGRDTILVDGSIQDQGLVNCRHVAHLVEQPLATAQVFLHLVLVETSELLK